MKQNIKNNKHKIIKFLAAETIFEFSMYFHYLAFEFFLWQIKKLIWNIFSFHLKRNEWLVFIYLNIFSVLSANSKKLTIYKKYLYFLIRINCSCVLFQFSIFVYFQKVCLCVYALHLICILFSVFISLHFYV